MRTVCAIGIVFIALSSTKALVFHRHFTKITQINHRPGHLIRSATTTSEIILLDHLNINHERGTHTKLANFYFDTLGFVPDPRKASNLEKGGGTVWANAGATQVHLSEGDPDPQVLDGCVTLHYPSESSLSSLLSRAIDNGVEAYMEGENTLALYCPFGNKYLATLGPRDPRGFQDEAEKAKCNGINEITLHAPSNSDLPAIAKFYSTIFGLVPELSETSVSIPFGPYQKLTFVPGPLPNSDYIDGTGPHISLYTTDLPSVWERACVLDLVYVNPRFKRRAETLDEAIDQCMFRVLAIVDPDSGRKIMRLEHEIRSKFKRDGKSKYKSYPFAS